MKKVLGIVLVLVVIGGAGFWEMRDKLINLSPLGDKKEIEKKVLEKYDFDSLKKRVNKSSEVKILGEPKEVNDRRKKEDYKIDFKSRVISFESQGKRIRGMMNYFNDGLKHPVIIMIRGYADKEGYYNGFGTWKAADRLAQKGFVTVGLDFLGFGGSDQESFDMLEARFEKATAVLDLIESVKKLDFVDPNKIGIWAHSNGGQIAISVLEATGKNYPTVLWAPMTNPFPKSVLDTASGLDDGGKLVIKAIADFEKKYDSRRYSIDNYYNWINAPIMIHQGTWDEWCKVEWQEDLQNKLKSLGKNVTLNIYPKDDHNLKKSWDTVVERDIEFFSRM